MGGLRGAFFSLLEVFFATFATCLETLFGVLFADVSSIVFPPVGICGLQGRSVPGSQGSPALKSMLGFRTSPGQPQLRNLVSSSTLFCIPDHPFDVLNS